MGQVTCVSSQTLSDMQYPFKFKEKRICTAVTLICFATNNFNKCFQKTGIFEWLGFGLRNIFMSRFSVREIWHPYLMGIILFAGRKQNVYKLLSFVRQW